MTTTPVSPSSEAATASTTVASPPPPTATGGASTEGSPSGASIFLGGGTLPPDPVASRFDAATAAVAAASAALGSALVSVAPGQTPRILKPRTEVEQGVLAMAGVLASFPTIASALSPTAMVAGVAQVQAAYRLVDALQGFTTAVEDTAKVTMDGIWKDARDGYHNASRAAKTSKPVARAIQPLQAMFARAPRETTAVVHAATDAVKAVKSTTRATKASTKLAASRQHATAVAPNALNALEGPTGTPATTPATGGGKTSG